MERKILVTCALLYANGPLHLGHLVEYIQADIWQRLQKIRGYNCVFVCGNDAHGTPIMLSAKKNGIDPETLIAQIHQEHKKDFADFHIEFDNFYTTHSPENQQLTEAIYKRLHEQGDIITHIISQAYDLKEHMFLPDRYVKGDCPRCGASDQYGDSCEVCGATYTPLELKNPVSAISGTPPIQKESEHYFFQLPKHTEFLRQWIQTNSLQEEIRNKLMEWFTAGLKEWDISRDAPYFGFQIPGTENKYFYVWLDAPIGYMASFKNLCVRRPELNFDEFWHDQKTELYHFIGKDIVYFHTLFWPALLHSAGYRTPTAVFAHGFLTINGQKMSKSRGTFIQARNYLDHLNPEYLRYYYAAKLTSHVEDLDLNLTDFTQRINADLVGKVVNIASRCASFINKHFNSTLSTHIIQAELLQDFITAGNSIVDHYEAREYSRAIRAIMELADRANQYIDAEKPWALMKEAGKEQHVHDVCSLGLNLFRLLILYLKPVLPQTAQKVEDFLNISPMTWNDREHILREHKVKPFTPLLQRITTEQIEALQKAS